MLSALRSVRTRRCPKFLFARDARIQLTGVHWTIGPELLTQYFTPYGIKHAAIGIDSKTGKHTGLAVIETREASGAKHISAQRQHFINGYAVVVSNVVFEDNGGPNAHHAGGPALPQPLPRTSRPGVPMDEWAQKYRPVAPLQRQHNHVQHEHPVHWQQQKHAQQHPQFQQFQQHPQLQQQQQQQQQFQQQRQQQRQQQQQQQDPIQQQQQLHLQGDQQQQQHQHHLQHQQRPRRQQHPSPHLQQQTQMLQRHIHEASAGNLRQQQDQNRRRQVNEHVHFLEKQEEKSEKQILAQQRLLLAVAEAQQTRMSAPLQQPQEQQPQEQQEQQPQEQQEQQPQEQQEHPETSSPAAVEGN